MHKRNLLGTLGLIVVLTLVLTACGGQATPEPTATAAPPTETPEPTNTPEPTVDVASLPVEDLQATLTALEYDLDMAEGAADGAAGEAASDQAEWAIRSLETRIEEVQALIAEAQGGEEAMDEEEPAAEEGTEEEADASLTLEGDFSEARGWTLEELEALDMITATVAGPRDDDPEAEYTGVSLVAFLEAAGLGEDATTLVATAADDFSAEIEVEAVQDCENCMLVIEEDGTLRLVMPGFASRTWVGNVVSLSAE